MSDNHEDPQLAYYRKHPASYARTATLIDICMEHAYKPCVGGWCDGAEDGGGHCERHARTVEVAERYLRMKERAR